MFSMTTCFQRLLKKQTRRSQAVQTDILIELAYGPRFGPSFSFGPSFGPCLACYIYVHMNQQG